MHELTLSELKERLIAQMDPDMLVEVLGVSIDDLVEALSDQIEENYDKLLDVLQEEDENNE